MHQLERREPRRSLNGRTVCPQRRIKQDIPIGSSYIKDPLTNGFQSLINAFNLSISLRVIRRRMFLPEPEHCR